MFNIQNNRIITIVRGDTIEIPLFINANTDLDPISYPFGFNDKVYFVIMESHQDFNCGVVRHEYGYEDLNESGDIVIKLSHDDTVNLLPGDYFYEIKLLTRTTEEVNGQTLILKEELDTIVPRTKFIILN